MGTHLTCSGAGVVCRYWASGACYLGDACSYLHVPPSGASSRDPGMVGRPSLTNPLPDLSAPGGHMMLPKSQRPCRNIEIYGYCKYAGKGCEYNHDINSFYMANDSDPAGIGALEAEESMLSSKRGDTFTGSGYSFITKENQAGSEAMLSSRKEGSPLGYELGQLSGASNRNQSAYPNLSTGSNARQPRHISHVASAPVFLTGGNRVAPASKPYVGNPSVPAVGLPNGNASHISSFPASKGSSLSSSQAITEETLTQDYNRMNLTTGIGHAAMPGPSSGPITHGGTTYYSYDVLPPQAAFPGQATLMSRQQGRRNIQGFFVSEALRQDLSKRTQAAIAADESEDNRAITAPSQVGPYHSLQLLESAAQERVGRALGYATTVFRALSSVDGCLYALRRIDGFRLTNKVAASHVLEQWRHFQHPNAASLVDLALSSDPDDSNSVYLIYDFVPGAETVEYRYLQSAGMPLPEPLLWSIFVQLATALRALHSAGFAARCVDSSKILVTTCGGRVRVKLGAVGLLDLVSPESMHDVDHFQREDLLALGKLILSLACRSPLAIESVSDALEYASSHYSPDLKQVLVSLLSHPASTSYPTAEQLCTTLAPHILQELEQAEDYNYALENELSKELENGRLFRLLVKLDFLAQQASFSDDPAWQEARPSPGFPRVARSLIRFIGGEAHALGLFRDHVFHQVSETGEAPVLDFGHVVECLNKLDWGTDERVALVSRDHSTVLVAAYKELKLASEMAFKQLLRRPAPPSHPPPSSHYAARVGRSYSPSASSSSSSAALPPSSFGA